MPSPYDATDTDDEITEDPTTPAAATEPATPAEPAPIEYLGFADEAPATPAEGDEAAPPADPFKGQEAPEWVKQTREENRQLKRRLREIEAQSPAAPKTPELGKKPALADHDYDEEAYQKALDDWYITKVKVEAAREAAEAEAKKAQERWDTKVHAYTAAKTALSLKDYDDAESAVQEVLTQTQIGILLAGTKAPAELVYALGKSPAKLKALKDLNPVETAFALARLEQQVQVNRSSSRPKVNGEAPVQGGARAPGGTGAELERLEADAQRTGDRTKVIAYKNQLRRAAQSR
jgi:hypothetical protein